jgi:tetratricopeptide (TPR) repeat protein
MSATARRTAVAPMRDPRIRKIEAVVAERAARELVALSQEILLLDPAFENAFPRERSRLHAPGLAAVARRALRRDAWSPRLSRALRREIAVLLGPLAPGTALPSRERLLSTAKDALAAAEELSPRAAAPVLVRAQQAWILDDSPAAAAHGFERAFERAAAAPAAASALLHRAILSADAGSTDRAIELLEAAARLEPRSLAIAWTLAVYALATGRHRLFERQLAAVLRSRDAASIRRRGLSLSRHMGALVRLGVLSPARARSHAQEFLARLPPLPDGGNRP